MTKKTIFENIKKLLVEELEVDLSGIKPESRFIDDLNLSSLDVMVLISFVEDNYGTELSLSDLRNISSINDLVVCIHNNKKKNNEDQ